MELFTAFGSGAVRLINQALLMGLIFGVLILFAAGRMWLS
mgnify:CR=1 FL=1